MRKKDSVVRARIDADLKAEAERVLSRCGLEFSDAIRLFLQQVVLQDGIPFPVEAMQRVERPPRPPPTAALLMSQPASHRTPAPAPPAARDPAPTPPLEVHLSGESRLLVRSALMRDARVFGWPSGSDK